MAINFIQGQILANNLQRDGIDLAFDTDLVYLDVGANAVGINTTTPSSTLEVVGNITVGNILIPNVGNVSVGNVYINNLLDPVGNQDAATKKYVLDNVGNIGTAGNLTFANTTVSTNLANGNITLTATGTGLVTIAGTSGFIMPTGNTAQRPAAGNVAGTLRFNTDVGRMEVYDGTEWDQVVGGVTNQTIVTADGSTLSFNLNRETTTAATLVMLNGVVQLPTTAYTITGAGGNVLTFNEAPAVSDIIDVRFL
jgi:uncharacterized membrane protein